MRYLCMIPFFAPLVTACSSVNSIGHLDKENSQAYYDLTPKEFIRQRFFVESNSAAKNAVIDYMAKATTLLSGRSNEDLVSEDKMWRRPELLETGDRIFWTAYYNNVNFGQLLKPKVDLTKYCESSGNRFVLVKSIDSDIFARSKSDSGSAYNDAYRAAIIYLSSTGALIVIGEGKDRIAENAGSLAYQQSDAWNAYIDAAYSTNIFRQIANLGGFGVFQCKSSSQISWSATILPFAYKQVTSNGTAAMRFSISINQ